MEILEDILSNWKVLTGLLLLIGIDVIPAIKISPIKSLLKLIGNTMNSDIKKDIDNIHKKIEILQQDCDFKDIQDIKNNLCVYQSLLIECGKLTEDQYNRCYELMDKYKAYQEKYNIDGNHVVNGKMDGVMYFIDSNYKKGNIEKDTNEE